METIGNLGIQLTIAVIYLAGILIPAYFTDKISDHFRSEARPEGLGCLPQAVIFTFFVGLFFFMLYPAKQALVKESCSNASDFQACVDGDDTGEIEYDRR